MVEGRPQEQREKMAKAVTDAIAEIQKIDKEQHQSIITPFSQEN